MPTRVSDIPAKLPASRRRKIARRTAELINEELTLRDLRRARKLTQIKLAKSLRVAQKQISEMEKRTDMHISTLRRSGGGHGRDVVATGAVPDREPLALAGIAAEHYCLRCPAPCRRAHVS